MITRHIWHIFVADAQAKRIGIPVFSAHPSLTVLRSERMYSNTSFLGVKDWGVFGTSLQIQDQVTLIITTDDPTPRGEESLGWNWAWALCYADELGENLLAGVSAKIIRQKLWTESDTAYAVDFGVQYSLSAPVSGAT